VGGEEEDGEQAQNGEFWLQSCNNGPKHKRPAALMAAGRLLLANQQDIS
jgi:hypothetical protein